MRIAEDLMVVYCTECVVVFIVMTMTSYVEAAKYTAYVICMYALPPPGCILEALV
jgi:hypothetical protein